MAFASRQLPALPQRLRCTPRLELLEDRNLLTFYGGYMTADEILAVTAYVSSQFPQITQLVDFGDSYSKSVGGVTTPGGQFLPGYDMMAVRVTNRAIPGPKPVAVIYAGLHAREISTPEVAMRFLYQMTYAYGYDPDVTWMVDHQETWIIPLANPDGHWYVELGTRPPYNGNPWLWRKNGRLSACNTWPGPGRGVDLNRNFADHWNLPGGASTSPCNETYKGTAVASEPEVAATQNLIRTLIPDQRGPNDNDPAPDNTTGILIDLHTYGGYVLWPWGHTSAAPPNSTGLTNIGRKLASYNGYTAGQSNQTLYATTGTSDGWVYTELGAPAYTIELNSGTFLAQYSTVNTMWNQSFNSLFYAARIARAPYQLARGPDAKTAWDVVYGPWMYAYAEIDDRQNGNQPIAAAEFYLDTPPWLPGAQAIPMVALDGAFNSPFEPAIGWADATSIPPGRHLVYMRGRDAAGNWGPVSAQFLDIGFAPDAGGAGVVPGLLAGMTTEKVDALIVQDSFVETLVANAAATAAVENGLFAHPSDAQTTDTPARSSAVQVIDRAFALELAALGDF